MPNTESIYNFRNSIALQAPSLLTLQILTGHVTFQQCLRTLPEPSVFASVALTYSHIDNTLSDIF